MKSFEEDANETRPDTYANNKYNSQFFALGYFVII